MRVIEWDGLRALLDHLVADGYTVVGPTVRGGAIVYAPIRSVEDLPEGWTDEQEGGSYRLRHRGDRALFGYAVGPHAWKELFFPPRTRLWSARRTDDGFALQEDGAPPPRRALIGVRACELHALRIQDRVFLEGAFVDPVYRAHREGAFLVAVQCGEPGGTCFCASMDTGPGIGTGYDLLLTEIVDPDGSHFTVEAGSEAGGVVLRELPGRPATDADTAAAEAVVRQAAARMGRSLDTGGLPELLRARPDHPRWTEVAARCLTCGNCTLVCPTCFCSTVEDTSDLSGEVAERWRRWDSCFNLDFSHLPGGSVRQSGAARYRQWLTHKLGTWHDQFGDSGCVGCGRCITWCPVGIDLTEEVAALRRTSSVAPDGPPDPGEASRLGGDS